MGLRPGNAMHSISSWPAITTLQIIKRQVTNDETSLSGALVFVAHLNASFN